ncbi:MAG: hypothetical protein IJZ20_00810, partial [Clostridia bacterium]|nr:hypothetical protein [Clostridia bacterium]
TLGKYYAYGNDAVSFSAKTGSVTFGNSMAATTKSVNDESFVGDIVQVREHKVNAGNFIVYEGSTNSNYAMIDGVGIVTNMIEVHKSSGVSGDYDRLRFEVRVFRVRKRDAYSFTEGFADCFKPGDAVKITGCGRYEVNNMTLIARDVVGDTIAFDDNGFVPADLEPGGVTLEREVPDFDVVCEHNNRIWGAGEDKIYASSLGDPTNYNVYDGLASDSWTVAVASPGKFTGCIGYSGNVIFFKEDMMYKVMGDYPSSFGMYPYNVAGVALGSEQSIVNINERLFYHSADGIYTYSGSLPQLVSYNFGARRFDSASAFAFGTKYYISMRGKDGFGLFVYDTLRDIWLREDSSEVIGFAERGNEKLMLCADGSLIQLDSGDEAVSWSVETCEFTEFIDNRKCYSRLLLRLDMESKSSVKVQIRRDRGRWETVYAENAENKMQNAKYPLNFSEGEYRNYYTVNVPLRPIRCDRFSIRISGVGKVVIRSLVREFEAGSTV